jgi:hypothetical protein
MLEDIAGAVVDLAAGLVALYEGDVEVPDCWATMKPPLMWNGRSTTVRWGPLATERTVARTLAGISSRIEGQLRLVLEAVLSSVRTRPASSRR